ncbi:MAG: hypothetical protein GXP32_07190 [Kiritimatiellaeota bacterium]|nr:hypothetical protein [Kiritimatiellota bacterium]
MSRNSESPNPPPLLKVAPHYKQAPSWWHLNEIPDDTSSEKAEFGEFDLSSTLSKTTLLIINELSAPGILLAQQIEDFQIQITQQI